VFDHVALNVSDYNASRAFYEQTLEPLGYRVVLSYDDRKVAGFGQQEMPEFLLNEREPVTAGTHVAFSCPDRETVDAVYAAAIAAGARDNGAPGVRERYHPTYYAAYVLDPDGTNIEVVCHR
jgi:catechol 2,3-dioxygenase-like lactoylglutathione lyase family enzyme